MEDLRSIQNNIDSAENLRSIVGIMKAHASSNIVRFQNAAKSSREYRKSLDKCIYVIMKDGKFVELSTSKQSESTLHIVFGSDHGLAGRFNERITSFAFEEIPRSENDFIFVVGQQILYRIPDGYEPGKTFYSPQTDEGIVATVQEIIVAVDRYREEFDIDVIRLYYNMPLEGVFFEERTEVLFPIDFESIADQVGGWKTNSLPTYMVDRKGIFTHLVQQYLFITLYRTICYSLASENASRFSSMQAAEKNIQERLEQLKFEYRQQRQNSITEEINDIVSGFKSIKKIKEKKA